MLKAVESFENETNFTVWSDLDSNLSSLSVLYQNTDCHDKFKSFVKKLFSPAMKSVGWDASEGEGTFHGTVSSDGNEKIFIFYF